MSSTNVNRPRFILRPKNISNQQSLQQAIKYLIQKDNKLEQLFTAVTDFDIFSVVKKSYPALIAAIIGQKIKFQTARALRSKLYTIYGTEFTPQDLLDQDLSFLGPVCATIINTVTKYIIDNNIDLTEDNIKKLDIVKGVGQWTIQTTMLTCLMDWDIFPVKDKFIETRMKKIYGPNCNFVAVSQQWAPYRSLVSWYLWRWFP